jgi:hypothetical protein
MNQWIYQCMNFLMTHWMQENVWINKNEMTDELYNYMSFAHELIY